jgi:hypothetical protein
VKKNKINNKISAKERHKTQKGIKGRSTTKSERKKEMKGIKGKWKNDGNEKLKLCTDLYAFGS